MIESELLTEDEVKFCKDNYLVDMEDNMTLALLPIVIYTLTFKKLKLHDNYLKGLNCIILTAVSLSLVDKYVTTSNLEVIILILMLILAPMIAIIAEGV